mgnify:CR=1 FL=1
MDITVFTELEFFFRILIAGICGGLIGYERNNRLKEAGIRTHLIVALAAALIMVVSKYGFSDVTTLKGVALDPSRIAAQIVTGVGFLGAGMIFVRNQTISGLTTAAGLWAAAIVGLCLGGGFYEGGIFATALILAAEMFLSKLEYRMLDNAPEVNLYMEYSNKTCLDNVLRLFRDLNLKVLNMEITRSTETETHNACALFTLRLNKRCRVEQLIPKMNATEGVVSVEEL